MLGIINPEHRLRRLWTESSPVSPIASSHLLPPRSGERSSMRRSSLPGAMSLAEAYNVMAVDVSCILLLLFLLFATRINKLFFFQCTAVLATINMLSAMEWNTLSHLCMNIFIIFNINLYPHTYICIYRGYSLCTFRAGNVATIHFFFCKEYHWYTSSKYPSQVCSTRHSFNVF